MNLFVMILLRGVFFRIRIARINLGYFRIEISAQLRIYFNEGWALPKQR